MERQHVESPGEDPVGCGALKLHGAAPAEIKRMWIGPEARPRKAVNFCRAGSSTLAITRDVTGLPDW